MNTTVILSVVLNNDCLLSGVTMDTRNTVSNSQTVTSNTIGKPCDLIHVYMCSCDLHYKHCSIIFDTVIDHTKGSATHLKSHTACLESLPIKILKVLYVSCIFLSNP